MYNWVSKTDKKISEFEPLLHLWNLVLFSPCSCCVWYLLNWVKALVWGICILSGLSLWMFWWVRLWVSFLGVWWWLYAGHHQSSIGLQLSWLPLEIVVICPWQLLDGFVTQRIVLLERVAIPKGWLMFHLLNGFLWFLCTLLFITRWSLRCSIRRWLRKAMPLRNNQQ